MRLKLFIPGILWFIITFILLSLPGDELPDTGFLNIPYLDKYVHMGLFAILTFLFCYPYTFKYFQFNVLKFNFFNIALLSILYGWLMEYFQKNFVRGRSFDVLDILMDALGSFIGILGIWIFMNKKIGPDRNRGRNQN